MLQQMHIILAATRIADMILLEKVLTVSIPAGTVYMLTDQTG